MPYEIKIKDVETSETCETTIESAETRKKF